MHFYPQLPCLTSLCKVGLRNPSMDYQTEFQVSMKIEAKGEPL